MDEADISATVDEVIEQMRKLQEQGFGPRPRLLQQCDLQLAVAMRLQNLHRIGVVGAYRMPCVHLDAAGPGVTVHAHFNVISEEDRT